MSVEMMKAVQHLVEVCEKVVKDASYELNHKGRVCFDLPSLEGALADLKDLKIQGQSKGERHG